MATALSPEELEKLGGLFKELGVKPSLESAAELKDWMRTLTNPEPTVKQEQPEKGAKPSPTKMKNVTVKEVTKESYRPRLSVFTGVPGKEGTSYDVWRYEVTCLLADALYSRETILEAVRRSVKGEAAKILMRLGPRADIQDILHKLDGLYGKVATEGTLLSQFYSAQQKDDEDVTAWSCRLEDTIQVVHDRGLIGKTTMQEMLRSKLWSGLRNEALKNATRYKYDLIKNFDDLVIEIRTVEQELGLSSGKKTVKSQSLQSSTDKTDKKEPDLLKSMSERLSRMERDMSDLKLQVTSARETQREVYRYQRGGGRGKGRRWQDNRGKEDKKDSSGKRS